MTKKKNKCTKCGSYKVYYYGKTKGGKQRFKCNDCGKISLEEYTYIKKGVSGVLALQHILNGGIARQSFEKVVYSINERGKFISMKNDTITEMELSLELLKSKDWILL